MSQLHDEITESLNGLRGQSRELYDIALSPNLSRVLRMDMKVEYDTAELRELNNEMMDIYANLDEALYSLNRILRKAEPR